MSKHTSVSAPLGELFVDATREVLEKGRIKAQMIKLQRIMEADRVRKKSIYAEIGRMYVEGSITKNKARLSYALKAIKHIDLRLERAQARYDMLEDARSLDECTETFRTELAKKISNAKDSVAITAYGVKKKAQTVTSGISDKSSEAMGNIKSAAKNIKPIGKKTKLAEVADDPDAKDFKALLAELEIADDEEAFEENAELNAVLDNIDAILREVEEESAEETAENTTEEATQTPEKDSKETKETPDGESAESFDF